MKRTLAVAIAAAALAVACHKTDAGNAKPGSGAKASGTFEAKSGSKVTGNVVFTEGADKKVTAVITVAGATPGMHGVHIHEKGDCSAPDAASAGGHLNPSNANHGAPGAAPHHLGDLGNMTVGADGKGTLTVTVDGLALDDGPNGVVNRSVIVHEKEDDLKTNPSGNSGARIACAVIHKD